MSWEAWGIAFSQRPFYQKVGFMVGVALFHVGVIHLSPSLYVTQFLLVLGSLIGGMLEPKRGFWLALMQMGILGLGHLAYEALGWYQTVPQETTFSTYVGGFSTLAGSALGAFIRRL